MKKIVISASAAFQKDIQKYRTQLMQKGYKVINYPKPIKPKNLEKEYPKIHTDYYMSIVNADILLILNLKKKGIANYIGGSVFAEMAFAIGLKIAKNKFIQVYCLNPLPKNLVYSDELARWKKLGWIKLWKKIK
ncbi:MAG: hypothetical protein ABH837_02065 [bacterium]